MKLSSNLEERFIRLIETRQLDTLVDQKSLKDMFDSSCTYKHKYPAAVYDLDKSCNSNLATNNIEENSTVNKEIKIDQKHNW